jgi:hypothetical protein
MFLPLEVIENILSHSNMSTLLGVRKINRLKTITLNLIDSKLNFKKNTSKFNHEFFKTDTDSIQYIFIEKYDYFYIFKKYNQYALFDLCNNIDSSVSLKIMSFSQILDECEDNLV